MEIYKIYSFDICQTKNYTNDFVNRIILKYLKKFENYKTTK